MEIEILSVKNKQKLLNWITALENNPKLQCFGAFSFGGEDKYCALGLLVHINEPRKSITSQAAHEELDKIVECSYTITNPLYHKILYLNDQLELSYQQIAEYLRKLFDEYLKD